MQFAVSFFDRLFVFCDQAVSGGYMVAVALICALQYLYHLYVSHQAAAMKRRMRQQIDDVQNDLRVATRDRTLTSLENQLLREFSEELDLDRTLDQLTRRLVAETKHGFAAYLALEGAQPVVTQARGLTDKARQDLTLDAQLLDRVADEGLVMLRRAELYGTELYDSLASIDRTRLDRIFLAGIGRPHDPAGILIMTNLIPCGIPLDQQMELTRRLVQSLSGIVKHAQQLQDRDRQLQSINEIMELRSVTDHKYSSPLEMIEAYVNRLRDMAGAERAVLFLVTTEGKGGYKPLCRCGTTISPASQKRYAEFEALLADSAVASKEAESLSGPQLAKLGINGLIGSALVAPVVSANGIAGALCLTRGSQEPFAQLRPELIRWATSYLSETLLKVLHQAVSEWHARQDPLTDLSNRRTFDQQFAAAMLAARQNGDCCSLLMVDIDRFKSVNDRYGHLAGDEVLRGVARILKETVGRLAGGGLASRFGGEEFAVMLPQVRKEEAQAIGEALRAKIEALPLSIDQTQLQVTVSVGVAVFPDDAQQEEDLIRAADAALYQAKESGRNRVLSAQRPLEAVATA